MKNKIINFEKAKAKLTESIKADLNSKTDFRQSQDKVLTLKKKYETPKAKCVGLETQQSPVMGCWNCGEDGQHC